MLLLQNCGGILTNDAGTAITEMANVTVGNKFLIKTTRDSKDYYGTLEINKITKWLKL